MYDMLMFFGRAICHQIAERSFIINGIVMPICARCTGIYIGVFSTILYLLITKRYKSNMIPNIPLSLFLLVLITPLAYDGVSSYLHLRESDNLLRIITGLPFGIVLPFFVFPLLNYNENSVQIRVLTKWYQILPSFVIAIILGFLTYKSILPYYLISTLVIITLIVWFSLIAMIIIKRIPFLKTKSMWICSSLIVSFAFLTSLSFIADIVYDILNLK